ncbi:MAG: Spo0E family sporulation regulatory protein-aspartic acid phosphatase [Bacillota bacterium]
MWNNRRSMAKQIKAKQREMYRLAKSKGVTHLDVYNKSCELDELIVEYMKKYGNVNMGTLFKWHDLKEKEGI